MTTLSSLLPPANLGNVTGTLPVANGGTGLTSPGTSGNILTSNGTAWVSQAPAAGGPTLDAIASGSLSDGSTVIVNADGTVSVVAGVAQTVGSPTVFTNSATISDTISATYDANAQKVVIAYADASFFGTAIVGTVSGTSISFGTPVVFRSGTTTTIAATYDENAQKVVIAYRGNLNRGTAQVGTVSGTSISFGTAAVFETSATSLIAIAYDANAQKVVVAYSPSSTSLGTAKVGTISGTSISFGAATEFQTVQAHNTTSITYDANAQKVVIAHNAGNGIAVVGTVSGTSISFGSPVVFSSGTTGTPSVTYDANAQKVVVAYNRSGGRARVGTVSGTSISFGSEVVFNADSIVRPSATYDANAQKVVIAYPGGTQFNPNLGTFVVGTVSGTNITFGTPVVFQNVDTNSYSAVYDANAQKVVIAYQNFTNSQIGTSVVLQNESTNLTAENFIGFSDGAYTNGQTATVQIAGAVDDAQSGLTAGQSYFVQLDGSLGLSPASPSVFAGTAVSASKIIVKR